MPATLSVTSIFLAIISLALVAPNIRSGRFVTIKIATISMALSAICISLFTLLKG